MTKPIVDTRFSGSAAENYEKFFVPVIPAPLASDLLDLASLRSGERVLDVACGTGIVTRLAAGRVGANGAVAGLDVDPGMLSVARAATPSGVSIEWYETSVEAMPLPDETFDVVSCQMGLQFFRAKPVALREMRRVLVPGGRVVINVLGPIPPFFVRLTEALARHVGAESASMMRFPFSLHDPGELRTLLAGARFRKVEIRSTTKLLQLPAPEEFLREHMRSTPFADAVAALDERQYADFERDVCAGWQEFKTADGLTLALGVITATANR
jgi:ubiquinone/menaquinone biosynthesis C-methylase UbiE